MSAIAAEPKRNRPRLKLRLLAGAAAAILVMSVVSTALASGARLSIPSQATLGSQITVTGNGFKSHQTGNLTYNGGVVKGFTASSSGSFKVSITIPRWAVVGTGRVSAKTKSGHLLATKTLAIVPSLSTSLPSASTSASALPSDGSPIPAVDSSLPNFSHIYVIVFENHEYSSVVGSSSAPYINSLISKYGVATNYDATSHPSEPNYIALTSGGTQGVKDDGTHNLGVNNIFDQVQSSGRTWRAYMQGYPGNCFTGSSSSSVSDGPGKSGAYVRKHDPAIIYTSISGNGAKCANITKLSSFDPAAASFEFITPNMINDMHDGSIADGDNFLKAFLPQITGSAAFNNSVVFVTFDEGSSNVGGGGHVLTLAITPNMAAGFKTATFYSHYSLLRTIEGAWGLPYLGYAASASSMAFPY